MNLPASRIAAGMRVWWSFLLVGSALLAIWFAVPGARAVAATLLAPLPSLGIVAGVHLFRPAQRRAWLTFGFGSAVIATAVIGFAVGDLFRMPIPTPSLIR